MVACSNKTPETITAHCAPLITRSSRSKDRNSERGEYHIPRAWAQGYRCIRIGWFLDFQAIRLPHVVRSAIQHLLIFLLDTFPLWPDPSHFPSILNPGTGRRHFASCRGVGQTKRTNSSLNFVLCYNFLTPSPTLWPVLASSRTAKVPGQPVDPTAIRSR